ncbi:MAG: beta-ketoacyl-[acyl-carrier-protein] synthase family protein [archaeon]
MLGNLERRVVVTGIGVCTPLGMDMNSLWDNLINGRDVMGPIVRRDDIFSTCKSSAASYFSKEQLTLKNLGLADNEHAKRRMAHFTRVAVNAAQEAVNDSGLIFNGPDELGERTGASIASGFGGISELEIAAYIAQTKDKNAKRKGLGDMDKFLAFKSIPGAATVYLANLYRLHAGSFNSPSGACASGAISVINGVKDIVLGNADAYLCGGTGDLSLLTFGYFDNLDALSKNHDYKTASRPFDRDRDGFVMGEGAGVIVLEEHEHAIQRGAKIYGEILGYSERNDAGDWTKPREDGKYITQAIKLALRMGKVNPEQIDYINAHGTSTPLNDSSESRGIRKALGLWADKPFVNSTKSMLGHTLNASGAIEAVVALKSMEQGLIHPTKNLYNPDEEGGCNLSYVKHREVVEPKKGINYTLSNSIGFGGRNVVLLLGKV